MKTKKRLNPIPPTLREKKRYILFELICDNKLETNDVAYALNDAFLSLFGSFGSARVSAKLIEWDKEQNRGILKCERSAKEHAIAALQFVREVKDSTVVPRVLLVSGTLRKLRESAK